MIKRITSSYEDISLLVSCILMPHVFGNLDSRGQSFIALLMLVDEIRAGSVIAFAAFNEKAELVGAAWGSMENDEFVVHSAFNRHINTEPYLNDMMEAVRQINGTETFTAYVPETYRYIVVGLGMQGWTVTDNAPDYQFVGQDGQLKPCVKLSKRLQYA